MIRQLLITTVAILIITSITLANMSIHGQSLTPAELSAARGGDPNSAKCRDRCDEKAGVVVPCTQVNADCTTCVESDAGGNLKVVMADVLGRPGDQDCGMNGGFKEGQGSQDCGFIQEGTCIQDPDLPGGWLCMGFATELICSEGIFEIVAQGGDVPPIIDDP
ncbi:hypothetical protein BH23PLA1_BH23PLA1_31150 [soil metagenome]